ncbi:tRNA (N(6)-L-threonylcarbamoyladenosine(37)-C(2))-methylthiotransferase MtaB, partial [Campylobacter jejuni]|nr:tRNA (N(6)-L-threonylcarbamoyladenosine(37)-C(2))-methylthiotransferase MtaB [Campylobacter jejuni]
NTLKVIIENNNYEFRKRVKTPLEILVENQKDGFFEGYDQFFNKIKIKSDKDIAKEWIVISEYEVQEKSNFANLKG